MVGQFRYSRGRSSGLDTLAKARSGRDRRRTGNGVQTVVWLIARARPNGLQPTGDGGHHALDGRSAEYLEDNCCSLYEGTNVWRTDVKLEVGNRSWDGFDVCLSRLAEKCTMSPILPLDTYGLPFGTAPWNIEDQSRLAVSLRCQVPWLYQARYPRVQPDSYLVEKRALAVRAVSMSVVISQYP